MTRSFRAALLAAATFLPALPAHAQDPVPPLPPVPIEEPIGPFVIDARGVWARFKQDPAIAASVGVPSSELPTRGLGLSVGAHVYPVRKRNFALGFGADLLLRARATRTIPPATEGGLDGPTVVTSMTAFSPQVSLNFGKRDGWSYISGGFGTASFTAELEDFPAGDADGRPSAINYGGGARWFAKKHLAFAFDLRFYSIGAQEATVTRPAYPAMRLMVLSAGISLR
jgi:hypothetical protein